MYTIDRSFDCVLELFVYPCVISIECLNLWFLMAGNQSYGKETFGGSGTCLSFGSSSV